MNNIKRTTPITCILAFCLVVLCATMLFVTQVNQPLAASAQDFSEDFLVAEVHDTFEQLEVVAAIEERLQGQGTSVVEVLYNQRDFYLAELSKASADEQAPILAMINSFSESIAVFEGTAFILPDDSNFGKDPGGVSTYSFGLSPNCTCDWLNILLNSPCGHCLAWSNLNTAVIAIQAGFWADGFYLAAELLGQSRINRVYGSHYSPTTSNAQRLIHATHLKEDIAYSNEVVGSGEFPSPEWYQHIPFVQAYNADAKYGIGGYTYRKTYHNSTHVNISIKDIYDYDGGDPDPFSATCYQAQQAGVIVPFYTIINDLIVPGTVPFNHVIQGDIAIVTGHGHFNQITIPTHIKKFGHEDPYIDNHMPDISVTQIGDYAFYGCTNLAAVTISDSVLTLGDYAFYGCSALKSVYIERPSSSGVTNIGGWAFEGCHADLLIYVPVGSLSAYRSVAWYNDWARICNRPQRIVLQTGGYYGDLFNMPSVALSQDYGSKVDFDVKVAANGWITVQITNFEPDFTFITTIETLSGEYVGSISGTGKLAFYAWSSEVYNVRTNLFAPGYNSVKVAVEVLA